MPDLNFPTSPSLNDIYSFGNKTWVWNGTAWQIQSSGAINGLPIGNSSPSTGAFTTLSASGNTTISGTAVLSNTVTFSGNIASNIVPAANVAYDLGSPTQQWRTLYVSGNTIFVGDSTITSNATAITLTNPSGATLAVSGNSTNSVGSFGSINATGNITGGNILTAGLISASGDVSAANFNVVSADLAELYTADADYEPGTVLEFGGTHEVTLSKTAASTRVAGVVSTAPATLMNSRLVAEFSAPLALTGRVPTSVVGTVRKGDLMVSNGAGAARACAQPMIGSVIGKALEDFSGASGVIEVVVGRL